MILLVVGERGKKNHPKPKKGQVMSIQLFSIWWPVPSPDLSSNHPLPVYILGMTCKKEYPCGQFGSSVLAILPHGFWCSSSLAEHETQSPSLRVSQNISVLSLFSYWIQNPTIEKENYLCFSWKRQSVQPLFHTTCVMPGPTFPITPSPFPSFDGYTQRYHSLSL